MTGRISVRKSLKIVGIAFLLLLCAIPFYPFWLPDGAFQRTLSPELMPTAEALEQNPLLLPQFIRAISPIPASTIKTSERICVVVLPGGFSKDGDASNESLSRAAAGTRLIVNAVAIPRESVEVSITRILEMTEDGRFSGRVGVCFVAQLDQGIHLIQIQIRNSMLGMFGIGELFSHEWMYPVE